MIENIFKTLGFKEEEVRTYLSLLDSGTQTAGNLAKIMGVARPTLYGHLEKLKEQGLVIESQRGGIKIFSAESAEKLRQMYDRKIEELQKQKKSLDTVITALENRAGSSYFKPKMRFFEGRNDMESALQDHISYKNCTMLSFWSIRSAIEATSEDFFWYLNKVRIKNNIFVKAIWPEQQAVDIKRVPSMGGGGDFKREIRIAPPDMSSSMGYWIYANKALFASSQIESFCFIIESCELVEMMSHQHKAIWNISTPFSHENKDAKPFLDDLYSN